MCIRDSSAGDDLHVVHNPRSFSCVRARLSRATRLLRHCSHTEIPSIGSFPQRHSPTNTYALRRSLRLSIHSTHDTQPDFCGRHLHSWQSPAATAPSLYLRNCSALVIPTPAISQPLPQTTAPAPVLQIASRTSQLRRSSLTPSA